MRIGTREPMECSPDVPSAEEGFRITAPRRVLLSGATQVPLCATARFKSEREHLPANIWQSTAIVVVSESGEELRVGRMGMTGGSPAPVPPMEPGEPGPPGDPENDIVLEGGSFSQWANEDLVEQHRLDAPVGRDLRVHHLRALAVEHAARRVRSE